MVEEATLILLGARKMPKVMPTRTETESERELRRIIIGDLAYKLGLAIGKGEIVLEDKVIAKLLKILNEGFDEP